MVDISRRGYCKASVVSDKNSLGQMVCQVDGFNVGLLGSSGFGRCSAAPAVGRRTMRLGGSETARAFDSECKGEVRCRTGAVMLLLLASEVSWIVDHDSNELDGGDGYVARERRISDLTTDRW